MTPHAALLPFVARCGLRRLAVGQMTSTALHEENLAACDDLCRQAVAAGAAVLAVPECFAFIGPAAAETVAQAETLDGHKFTAFRDLARRHGLWLALGGFHEKKSASEDNEAKVSNAHVVVDEAGAIVTVYRKMHLFDVEIPGGAVLMESRSTARPPARAVLVDTPVGRLGLTTCYDLRFPELYTALARRGADCILVPSAFTVPTGQAHWHLLLRARAVETQAYIAAPAQWPSLGHALAVDPWGVVLGDAQETSPSIVTLDIDRAKLDAVRTRMPIQSHRRRDVLQLALDSIDKDDDDDGPRRS